MLNNFFVPLLGARSAKGIVDSAINTATDVVRQKLGGKKSSGGGGGGGGSGKQVQ